MALHAAFVHVIVPAAAIDEQNFHADVGFQELADLLHVLAQAARRILRAVFRRKLAGIDFAEHVDGFERFGAGAVQRLVHGLRVHGFEAALRDVVHGRRLRHDLEIFQIRQRDGAGAASQHARQIRAHGHGAKWRGVFFRHGLHGAIEPAVVGGFHAGRARFHEILRVKMRARGIGRARRVHDGQLVAVKQRLQRREAGMQSEESVEIDGCGASSAAAGLRNRDGRAHAVVIRLGEGHDDVQAVRRAALKQHDQLFLVGHRRGGDGALQECGHGAQARPWPRRPASGNIVAKMSLCRSLRTARTLAFLLPPLKFRRAEHQARSPLPSPLA